MTLKDLLNVVTCDFIVNVRNGTEFIEEFNNAATGKRVKYRDAVVTGVCVFNEENIAISVDIAEKSSLLDYRMF